MKDSRLLEMQVFKCVAEAGGFTAAARLLGASQPALSRTVSDLEQRLGVPLLRRSTRRISLTEEGRLFLASCTKIIDDIAIAEEVVASESTNVAGQLRITAGTSFGLDQIVPILPDFLRLQPRVRLSLSLSDRESDIIAEGIDVAIRMGRLKDSMLLSRKLCHLQRLIVAAPSYIERRGMPELPNDLLQHDCLTWEAPLDHLNEWRFQIDKRQIAIEVSGTFSHITGAAATQMCLAGVGIARMAEHVAVPAVRDGRLIALLTDFQVTDDAAIYAVSPTARQTHRKIIAFTTFLVDRFKHPPWRMIE